MTITGFLLLMLIAFAVGSVAKEIVGLSRSGCLVTVGIGWLGSLLGTLLSMKLGLPEPFPLQIAGKNFPLLWSLMGAVLFVLVVAVVSGRKKH